nr:immunoglobulin light chain junction region [Macaca mulatta]
FMQAIELPLTF